MAMDLRPFGGKSIDCSRGLQGSCTKIKDFWQLTGVSNPCAGDINILNYKKLMQNPSKLYKILKQSLIYEKRGIWMVYL